MTHPASVWAEFDSAESIIQAARELSARGYRGVDSFTPYSLPELEEVLGLPRPWLIPAFVAAAACFGGALAYLVIWWTAAISYPLDVGGRPLNSFVADIPILFESSVLAAAITGFASMLLLSGMPRLSHPLECLPGFERTTNDRFWLGIRADDGTGELAVALQELHALRVHEVEAPGA